MVVEKGDNVGLSQVLWMALQAGDHVLNWLALETDLINSREQGEPGELCKLKMSPILQMHIDKEHCALQQVI